MLCCAVPCRATRQVGTLSVRETLMYAARLRLPMAMTYREKVDTGSLLGA